MSKIKIKVTVTNSEGINIYSSNAIILDNIIKYKENDNTTVIYNYSKNELIRDNKDLKMNYIFDKDKKTIGKIEIKELNKIINLKIQTKELNKNKNDIKVNFQVEGNDFIYQLEEEK